MIGMTTFAAGRHFNPDFGGTKIGNFTPEDFVARLNEIRAGGQEAPGYAPFCIHLFIPNFTDAQAGVVEITDANRHHLKTGFKARREGELPVLTRWFEEADVPPPPAPWLDTILYSREQLEAEGSPLPEGVEWGVVAILSATEPKEAPMNPITMMRNALGKGEGGSGVPLDRDAYMEAVGYWSNHATVQ